LMLPTTPHTRVSWRTLVSAIGWHPGTRPTAPRAHSGPPTALPVDPPDDPPRRINRTPASPSSPMCGHPAAPRVPDPAYCPGYCPGRGDLVMTTPRTGRSGRWGERTQTGRQGCRRTETPEVISFWMGKRANTDPPPDRSAVSRPPRKGPRPCLGSIAHSPEDSVRRFHTERKVFLERFGGSGLSGHNARGVSAGTSPAARGSRGTPRCPA
jgi:hypothetical protein